MSDIKNVLMADMKTAMKEKQTLKLSTIRMALAAIKQKEIDEKIEVTDSHIIDILTKMIKQRKDSSQQYQQAGRIELAEKEDAEITHLEHYLPQALTEDELKALIEHAIEKHQAQSIKDMGKVMGSLKADIQGKADPSLVANIIKSKLN